MIAYIGLYFVINLIYREVLVKNSECEQCLKVGNCSSLQRGPTVDKNSECEQCLKVGNCSSLQRGPCKEQRV